MAESQKDKICFVINPRSGGKRTAKVLRKLKEYAICSENCSQVVELSREIRLDNIIEASAPDIIVVGGGDGTFSTLLPTLSNFNSKIGIMPLGTGNDLARELGISGKLQWNDISQIVKFYREAPSRETAYFCLQHGEQFSSSVNFINYVSFGFDAKVVEEFAQLRESKFLRSIRGTWSNRLAYTVAGLMHLGARISSKNNVEIASKEQSHSLREAKSIIFANICSIMGMGKSNLRSLIFDEKIECVIANGVLNYISMLTQHKMPIFKPRLIGSSSSWGINGLPSGISIQIDGEPRPDIEGNEFRVSYGGSISMLIGPSQC